MKKRFAAAFTAALVAAGSVSVLADVELVPVATLEDCEWVYGGSSLLQAEGTNGYALADAEGSLLTEDIYGWSFEYEHGYVVTCTLEDDINTNGVLDRQGQEVVPFQYADIDVMSTEWIVGYNVTETSAEPYDYTSWTSDAKYLIQTVDIYHMPEAVCVASLTRDEFEDASVVGHSINIKNRSTGAVTTYDGQFNELGTVDYVFDEDYAQVDYKTYRENGQTGLTDGEGNVLIAPSFQYMEDVKRGYVEVDTGDMKGLMDVQGNLVIPAEYEDIEYSYYMPYDDVYGEYGYNAFGYFCVIRDGKLGYVDETGAVTCEPKYSEDVLNNYGASATYTDMEGVVHILSADGVDTALDTAYKSVYAADGAAGLLYTVNDADYNTGLVDWHGNVLFPCEYYEVEVSGDGQYVLVQKSYSDPVEIYQINYNVGSASAGTADESEAEPEESSLEAAAVDLTEVLALLDEDAAGNQTKIVELLNAAAETLEADNVGASTILKNAAVLLESDAATNGSSVRELVAAAADMLK